MSEVETQYLDQGPTYSALLRIKVAGETIHFTQAEAAALLPWLKQFAETGEIKEQPQCPES